MTFLLCDPGWCVHKSDVQNKWDDNTHTHAHHICVLYSTVKKKSWQQDSLSAGVEVSDISYTTTTVALVARTCNQRPVLFLFACFCFCFCFCFFGDVVFYEYFCTITVFSSYVSIVISY